MTLVSVVCCIRVNHPGVLLFPKVLVCLDCGFLVHAVPTRELALLPEGTSKRECPADKVRTMFYNPFQIEQL
jgi:hypothetical protein